LKGRVIGQGGKTRRNIEELTSTFITIFGNTIGIIGELENQQVALTAIIRLLRGAEHSTVYRYLNDQRRRLRRQRQQEMWRPVGPGGSDQP
jgi:ribosomal RNA assembly protein